MLQEGCPVAESGRLRGLVCAGFVPLSKAASAGALPPRLLSAAINVIGKLNVLKDHEGATAYLNSENGTVPYPSLTGKSLVQEK